MKKLIKKILVEETVDTDTGGVDYDYTHAVIVAQEVEDWWKGDDRYLFFRRFNYWYKFDDDKGAAEDYKVKEAEKYLEELGTDNKYYKQFEKWFDDIVDEIDDVKNDKCWIYLKTGAPYYKSSSFYVDPEIDYF